MNRLRVRIMSVALAAMPLAAAQGQQVDTAATSVVATIDSALRVISRSDFASLATMMLPEAMMFAVQHADSVRRYSATTQPAIATTKITSVFLERGFAHEVKVSGPLATAWVPYDFYRDGKWSHCGIDVFTLLRVNGRWMIASLAYTVAQPPACRPHPDKPGS